MATPDFESKAADPAQKSPTAQQDPAGRDPRQALKAQVRGMGFEEGSKALSPGGGESKASPEQKTDAGGGAPAAEQKADAGGGASAADKAAAVGGGATAEQKAAAGGTPTAEQKAEAKGETPGPKKDEKDKKLTPEEKRAIQQKGYEDALGTMIGGEAFKALSKELTFDKMSKYADQGLEALFKAAGGLGKDSLDADSQKNAAQLATLLDGYFGDQMAAYLKSEDGQKLMTSIGDWVLEHPRTVATIAVTAAIAAAAIAIATNMSIPEIKQKIGLGGGFTAEVMAQLGKVQEISLDAIGLKISQTTGKLTWSAGGAYVKGAKDDKGNQTAGDKITGEASFGYGDKDRRIDISGKGTYMGAGKDASGKETIPAKGLTDAELKIAGKLDKLSGSAGVVYKAGEKDEKGEKKTGDTYTASGALSYGDDKDKVGITGNAIIDSQKGLTSAGGGLEVKKGAVTTTAGAEYKAGERDASGEKKAADQYSGSLGVSYAGADGKKISGSGTGTIDETGKLMKASVGLDFAQGGLTTGLKAAYDAEKGTSTGAKVKFVDGDRTYDASADYNFKNDSLTLGFGDEVKAGLLSYSQRLTYDTGSKTGSTTQSLKYGDDKKYLKLGLTDAIAGDTEKLSGSLEGKYTEKDLTLMLGATFGEKGSTVSGSAEKWAEGGMYGKLSTEYSLTDSKLLSFGAAFGYKDPKRFETALVEYYHKNVDSVPFDQFKLTLEHQMGDWMFRAQGDVGLKSGQFSSAGASAYAAYGINKDFALIGGGTASWGPDSAKQMMPQVGVQVRGVPILVGYDMNSKAFNVGITIPFGRGR